MGARFRIVLYAPDAATAARASQAAFKRIAALDNIMSDYVESSELMRLCRESGGPPVKLSGDLYRVLNKAQEVAAKSDGAFDVTVGPLVQLWRRARREHELPDGDDLARARQLVGYDNLRLNATARTAELLKRGMLLDLGGIAKGDAADQALNVLKGFGIERALVAAAGDIAASGPPPGEKGWTIGIASLDSTAQAEFESKIRNPKSRIQNSKAAPRYILLRDAAVSTSGDAEQHVEISGVRYSHIINPGTGQALTGRSSVTVIAPDGITADGFATAVGVLGPERGLALVESLPGAAALYVLDTAQGVRIFEARFPK